MDHPQKSRDPLVELVEMRLADGAPAREIIAAVLEQLAVDMPENYRTGVQDFYRGWLRQRAKAVRNEKAIQRPTGAVTEMYRWQ